MTVTIQKRKGPSGKVLFSGALTFLWEKEKIRTEDAIRFFIYTYNINAWDMCILVSCLVELQHRKFLLQ